MPLGKSLVLTLENRTVVMFIRDVHSFPAHSGGIGRYLVQGDYRYLIRLGSSVRPPPGHILTRERPSHMPKLKSSKVGL